MLIYLLLLAIIVITKLICGNSDKLFTILSGAYVFLLLALKKETVGADTIGYVNLYENETIVYIERFIRESNTYFSFANDPLYFIYSYIFLQMGVEIRLYFAVTYALITFLIFRFIYKYSENKFLSIFTYVTIGLFSLSFSGLRQMLAISISTFSLQFLIEKKPMRFLCATIISAGFHMSALIVIPMYILVKALEKVDNIKLLLIGIVCGLILSSSGYGLLLSNISNLSRFSIYLMGESVGSNPLFVLFYIGILCICLFIKKTNNLKRVKDDNNSIFVVIYIIGIIILILSMKITIVSRMSYYYIFVLPIIVSNSISRIINGKNRFIYVSIFCVLEFLYFSISTPSSVLALTPYLFFWE